MTARAPILVLLAAALCGQVSLPLEEDFEADAVCTATCGVPCALTSGWSNATDDAAEWIVRAGTTPSNGTGPSRDADPGTTTGHYAYVEASNACSPGRAAHLLSPVLDPGEAATLRFRYHQLGADMGTLSVDQQEPVRHQDGQLVGATERLTSATADFSTLSPGMHVAIVGSLANDGVYPVLQVVSASTVVLDTGGAATDEGPLAFDVYEPDAPWTLDVFGPVTDDIDAWQAASCVPLAASGVETRLRFAAVTGSGFLSDMAIDAIAIEEPAPIDLAIEALSTDPLGCGETTTALTATLRNRGRSTLTGVPLTLRLDGGPALTEIVPGALPPCGVVEHTFAAPLALLTSGNHTVVVAHGVAGDGGPGDDEATLIVHAPPILAAYPAVDDLEEDAAARWRVGGDLPSWAAGDPAKAVIVGAASGSTAWVTGGLGPGGYPALEDSWVEGACYDFTHVAHPRIELRAWWDTEFSWDGAIVEASVDDGASWTPVGDAGDPVNWYTDDTVVSVPGGAAWSGATSTSNGSGGWVAAGHALDGLAGEPLVRLRVRFGADGTVQDDGFGFDDWTVLDAPPGVRIAPVAGPVPADAVDPGADDVLLLAFEVEARGAASSVSSIGLSLEGVDAATLNAVELWLDDGDGAFDPALDVPFQDNPELPVAGVATFDTTNDLVLPAYLSRRVFASVDLRPSAAGAIVQASLDPADVASGAAILLDDPLFGASRGVLQAGPPPLIDDCSGGSPRRTADLGPGVFPDADGVGLPPIPGPPTAVAGEAGLVDAAGLPAIPSASLRLVPPGAVDYHLDLAGQPPAGADLALRYAWRSPEGGDDAGDAVFLSVDGGLTWATTLAPLPGGAADWQIEQIDLAAAFAAAGLPFTADVVVRFQAVGGGALELDDVFVGELPHLRAVRGVALTDGGSDDVGDLPVGEPTAIAWSLHNDGDLPLVLGPPTLSGLVNASAASVSVAPAELLPGDSGVLTVEVTPAGAGPVSLAWSLPASDPRLTDGSFDLAALGTGTVIPALAVAFEGAPVGTGDVIDVGVHTAGVPLLVALDLSNAGTGPLSFTGSSPLVFASAQNVVASVDAAPPDPLLPGASATALLSLTAQTDGPCSVAVLIQTDDPDHPVFTVTLSGLAVSPGLQIVRGGIIPPGGVEDAGPRRPGDVVTWGYSLGNTGTGDVTLTGSPDAVVLDGILGPVAASVTSQPASTIPVGASVGFALQFEVTGLGPFSFDVVIESNDPEHPEYSITVAGEGVEPEVQLADAGGDLPAGAVVEVGAVRVGVASLWSAWIDNLGSGELALLDVPPVLVGDAVAVDASVLIQPGSPIGPGSSEPLAVELVPTALGPFSAVIEFTCDDADEPVVAVQLHGTGVLPRLRVERAGLPLADGGEDGLGELRRGEAATVAWVVANDGTGELGLIGAPEALAVLGAVGVQVAIGTPPPPSLGPGEEAVFALELVPLDDVFAFDLVLPTDDPAAPSFTLHASGVAVASSLSVSRDAVPIPPDGVDDRGELPLAPGTLEWTLSNPGSATLHWLGPPAFDASGGVLVEAVEVPGTLAPGASAPLRAAFVPGQDGDIAFDVALASDDPDVPLYAFTVVATVTSPALRLSRDGVELASGADAPLGEMAVGAPVTWTWTLSNDGTADAHLAVPEPAAVRALEGGALLDLVQPPAVLVPGTAAAISVTARADAPGPVSFDLVVSPDGGPELRLHAVARAVAEPGPAPPDDPGCGCEAAGGGATATWLVLLLGGVGRRGRGRRRLVGRAPREAMEGDGEKAAAAMQIPVGERRELLS